MARVREVRPEELPAEAGAVYRRFVAGYGPFREQVAVFAHCPPAVEHLMGMLLELRQASTMRRRHLELAIVAVSKLNECHYCVAHHKPMLMVEGLSAAGADAVLDFASHPEFDEADRLVVEYAIAVTDHPQRIPETLFERLRRAFSEPQIVELTLRIALCGFFNRFNDALQIDDPLGHDAANHDAAHDPAEAVHA
jgi:uncharacterized peroxidase-related enzyme